MNEIKHIPVLYEECLNGLNIKPNGIYLDMTLGGFGHGAGICSLLDENGTYIGLDLDIDAVNRGEKLSATFQNKKIFCHTNYKNFESVLNENGIITIDGCLMDLGVSSFQIDDAARGFSFMKDGPLDMRMDMTKGITAADVVNSYSQDALKEIIYKYGEERFAPRIANAICENRKTNPIETTLQLSEIIKQGIPKKFWYEGRNPATKTFQAIRIEVNEELTQLFETIIKVIDRLNAGGRVCIISFHSLEDRIVKSVFAHKSKGCDCPKDFPVCVCGKVPEIKLITKSPIIPSEKETAFNPRSRSAKLRIAQKLSI